MTIEIRPVPRAAKLIAAGCLSCVIVVAWLLSAFAVEVEEGSKGIGIYDLQALASNGNILVAVGGSGSILRSADSGENWELWNGASDASFIDVAACPDQSFVALDFYRRIWASDVAGLSWAAARIPGAATPLSLACAPDGAYWVSGSDGSMYRSGDKGESWADFSFDTYHHLTAIHFVDGEWAVVAGEQGFVATSDDGGESWSEQDSLPEEFYVFDTWWLSRTEGWVLGRAGQILHTVDGGESWSAETNPLGAMPLYRFIGRKDGEKLFAVGELGYVVYRENERWRKVDSARTGGYLRGGVYIPEIGRLVVVGGGGAETPKLIEAKDGMRFARTRGMAP